MGADIKGQTMAALPGTLDAMNEQSSKACSRCGAVKQLDLFYKDTRMRDGRAPHCKECHNARSNARSRANRDRRRELQRAWRQANIDSVRAKAKAAHAKAVELLAPYYCAEVMRIPRSEITPELLALKREQLTIRRLARQLKEKANEGSTDPR